MITNMQTPQDCPGGPAATTPHSQCKGPGFDPGQGTRSHATAEVPTCPYENPAKPNKYTKINIFQKYVNTQ